MVADDSTMTNDDDDDNDDVGKSDIKVINNWHLTFDNWPSIERQAILWPSYINPLLNAIADQSPAPDCYDI